MAVKGMVTVRQHSSYVEFTWSRTNASPTACDDAPHNQPLNMNQLMLSSTLLDDFAISPMGAPERNDLLELLDDRVGTRSTLITSQLPVKAWHTYLDDPTLADAILDRVVHSSHRIDLKGATLRDNKRIVRVDSMPMVVTA